MRNPLLGAGRAAAALALLVGVATFVGWWRGVAWLVSVVPGWPATHPGTSAGIVFAGISLLCVRPVRLRGARARVGLSAALLTALAGAPELVLGTGIAERVCALSLILLGGALSLIHLDRAISAAQGALAGLLATSMIPVLAILFGQAHGAHLRDVSFLLMAFPTTAAFLVLGAAGLGVSATRGFMRTAIQPGPGRDSIRGLFGPAVGTLIAVALLRVWAQEKQIFNTEVGTASLVMAGTVVIATLLWRNARALSKNEHSLAATLQSIGDGVLTADVGGRIVRLNAAAERLTGWTEHQAKGRPIHEVFRILREDTREPVVVPLEAVIRRGERRGFGNHTLLIAADGTERPIADSAAPVQGDDGPVEGVVLVFRDVTSEREAETALERAAEHLETQVRQRTAELVAAEQFNRGTLDALAAHIAVLAPDGVILAVNESWRRFALANGVAGAAGPGVNYLTVCDQAGAEGVAAAAEAARAIRDVQTGARDIVIFEYDCHSPDQERWFECRTTRFPSDPPRVVVAHRDITGRRQAATRLEQSERRFAEFFRAAPDATVIVDAGGLIVAASDRTLETFGWSEQELVGRSIEDLVPPRVRSKHVALRAAYSRDPGPRRTHVVSGVRGLRKDGTEFPAEVSLSPLSWQHLLIAAAVRDVSGVHAVEEALRRSEEQFRGLVEGSTEVFFKVTAGDDPLTGRLEYLSPRVRDLTGRSSQEFADDPELLVRLLHPDDRADFEGKTRLAFSTGAPQLRTYRFKGADGQYRWIEDNISPRTDESGRVIAYTGVARDLTDRRRWEAQSRQSQKMETLGQLAGGIAHDFNNLLTVILGTVDLRLGEEGPDSAAREDLQIVREVADQAADLTRQLLAFSRQQVLEPRIVDLNQLVTAMMTFLRRLIGENIEITYQAEDVKPVLADPHQLNQVLVNLAVNARDAMPGGGTLTLRTWNMTPGDFETGPLHAERPNPRVALSVSDTGVGMTEEIQAQIFDPFFTTKARGRGTGLGLATVHGIVTQSGGAISVRSEPGRGTTFTISFPVADPEPESEAVRAAADRSHLPVTQRTVLVVEDHAKLRRLASRMLESGGYRVLVAANGEEALQLLADNESGVDVLFTDLVMPGMTGIELATRVRATRPEILVLFTSGYTADVVEREQAGQAGSHFISKPYSKADLLGAIHALCEG